MKAAVLEKLNTPLTVADVEPGELVSGQVLVKREYMGSILQ